ncbi:hypothetical protein GCM10009836_29540 [Pseudonocardia ailaonensis]|uniref:BON domain-containing protein n=1 Tax=Pseudonocardia ailaonensis TaxID=367279 RepID=A0ABN2N2H5_9PSEU
MRERRIEDVDSVVAGLDPGSSPHGRRLRAGIETLRGRLRLAHGRCEQVDERRWADYRAALDTGVGELDVELGRVAEHHDVEEVDERVYPHLARLELEAWRLRIGEVEESMSVDLVTYAHRELVVEGPVRREDVERILDAIRVSVPFVETSPAPR